MSTWTDAAWNEAHERRTGLIFQEATKTIAARIAHTCSACGREISPGRSYRREVSFIKGAEAPKVYKEHAPDCYSEALEEIP